MSGLIFAQAFALCCLIGIVVGFVFWCGFVAGRVWQARQEEKPDDNDMLR